MNLANRCRTCIQNINQDPVKITQNIYEFLEQTLQLNQVPRQHHVIELPQNICFGCFVEISRCKRFYQLCKDSEEFLKSRLESHEEEAQVEEKNVNCKEEYPEINIDEFEVEVESEKEFLDLDAEEQQEESHNDEVDIEENVNSNISTEILLDENVTFYEENVEEGDLIEYQVTDLETDVREDVVVAYENIVEEDDTEQTCEVIDIDEILDGGEEIEITLESSDMSPKKSKAIRERKNSNSKSVTGLKDYTCRICGKSFNSKSTLRSHEYIHTDARPFICEICGKSFRQANVLVTHMAALHTGKKIECELCGKKFARKSQMILHNRMHKDEKPFVCDYPDCHATFRQNQYLLAHKETHTGVRRYQCTLCGRRFYNRPSLLGHMHRVHGSIYYQCDLCVKEFKKSQQLRNHMKAEHHLEISDVSHLKKRKASGPETIMEV